MIVDLVLSIVGIIILIWALIDINNSIQILIDPITFIFMVILWFAVLFATISSCKSFYRRLLK